LTTDQLSLDPEHAIPRAPQLQIPSRISTLAPCVIASINFNDQPLFGRQEINDEAEHRDLPTKFNSGLPGAKRCPERGF